jgi:hypothetical protein
MTPPPVAPPMRPWALWTVVLVAGLLAGCTTPTNKTAASPLLGLCPQWMQGGGSDSLGVHVVGNASETRELGPAAATFQGKPLDLYRIHVDDLKLDGRLELRAFAADGRQLAIRDYRQAAPQLVPVVVFTDGTAADHEFDLFLSPVTQNGTASPAPATLRFTASGTDTVIDLTVTYHYKVCGAEV